MAELEQVFRRAAEAHVLEAGSAGYEGRVEFALHRLEEGRKVAAYLAERYPEAVAAPSRGPSRSPSRGRARVLDLGCGNGGLLLPWAEAGHRCWGLDLELHPEVTAVGREAGLPLAHAQGRGEALPFPDASFDLVLLAETLEHVERPRHLGREAARVLRPGGICYVTTPPRLRFLLGRDPHYDLPGLLLLPDGLQRLLFERLLYPGEEYAVTHTFWSAAGVLRCLPGLTMAEITSKHWAGPGRRLDWDWIVARKPHGTESGRAARRAPPPGGPEARPTA